MTLAVGRWGGAITNEVLKFRKLSEKFMDCNLLLLYLSSYRWKKNIYQLRKQIKICKISQGLKLWARVPVAVISCPDAAHM